MNQLPQNFREPKSRFAYTHVIFAALAIFIVILTISFVPSLSASSVGKLLRGASRNPDAASVTRHSMGVSHKAKTSTNRGGGSPGVAAANLNFERQGHTATRLGDGKILIAGGENTRGPVKESEIYDPVTRRFATAA